MARSKVEILADKFEQRFAPLFEIARTLPGREWIKPGGPYECVTPRSLAMVYASRIVGLANQLIPDARKRNALLEWPTLPILWSFTDHGLYGGSDADGDQAFTRVAVLILFSETSEDSIAVINHEASDVAACIAALRELAPQDADAATVADALESGRIAPMGYRARHDGQTDEARAITKWTPRECVRLMAATRHAVEQSDPIATLVRAPTYITDSLLSARDAKLAAEPHRLQNPPALPKDLTGNTFPVAAMTHWVLDTATERGSQLWLPLPSDCIPRAQGFRVETRNVLSGSLLRVWLACLALLDEQPLPGLDGGFIIDPRHVLMDLLGSKPRKNKSKGKLYLRPTEKAESQLRESLAALRRIYIRKIGNRVIDPPESLITRYAVNNEDFGDAVYRHASATMVAIRSGRDPHFTQVPRSVMRLDADDVPVAMGVANHWRARIVRDALGRDAPGYSRDSVYELASRIGLYRPKEEAKLGRGGYWNKTIERLTRIVQEGDLGSLSVQGDGRDAVATLTPSKILADAYEGLLRAQEAARARSMERVAAEQIAEALIQRRKPGRPRKRRY